MFSTVYNCNFFLSNFINLGQFVAVSVVFLISFSLVYFKNYKGNVLGDIGLVFIVLGGVMNLAQWVMSGCVRDFINFFGLFHFNFYDLLVTIGAMMVGIIVWKKK